MTESAGGSTPPPLQDLQTRFLYPFHLLRSHAGRAFQALRQMDLGPAKSIWEATRLPSPYSDELIDHAAAFLVPAAEGVGSIYLRVPHGLSAPWFANATVRFPDWDALPIRQIPGTEIELFVTDQGSGVLSMPLTLGMMDVDTRTALAFNYYLSHARHGVATEIHIPHPSEDQKKWAQMLVAAREHVRPSPARFAPLEERLGAPGGTFTLAEVLTRLLRPLEALSLRPLQRGLAVFTVACLAHGTRSDRRDVAAVGAFLEALALIREPDSSGAGSASADTHMGREIGAFHWAAAGPAGAAQIVMGRPTGEGSGAGAALMINRARDTYFGPYWLALNQRILLQGLSTVATEVVFAPANRRSMRRLADLRHDLLRYGALARFRYISPNPGLEKFYELCLKGLGVSDRWETLGREIAELEGRDLAQRQAHLAASVARSRRAVANVQRITRWTGTFVISGYAALLYHLIASNNPSLRSIFQWFGADCGDVFFAVIGLVGGLLLFGIGGKRQTERR